MTYPKDLGTPLTYFVDTGKAYEEKSITIPNEIIAAIGLGFESDAEEIIKHHTAIGFYSNKISNIIKIIGTPEDITKSNPELAIGKTQELYKYMAKLEYHVQHLEVLIALDDNEKAEKQLIYGTEKYRFIINGSITNHLEALQERLLEENKMNSKGHSAISQEEVIIRNILQKLESDFDAAGLAGNPLVLKTMTGGGSVSSSDIEEGSNRDANVVKNLMVMRNDTTEVLDSLRMYPNSQTEKIENAKFVGGNIEFTIRLLTTQPYFTYDYAKYKAEKKLGHRCYYLDNDKYLYE